MSSANVVFTLLCVRAHCSLTTRSRTHTTTPEFILMTTLLQFIQSSPTEYNHSCGHSNPSFQRNRSTTLTAPQHTLVPPLTTAHSAQQQREYRLLYLRRLLELLISFAQDQYDRFLIGSELGHYLPFSGLLNSQKSQEYAAQLNKLLALEYSILDEAEALSTGESVKIPKIRLKQRDTCFLLQTRQMVVEELLREISRSSGGAQHKINQDYILELEHRYRKRILKLKHFE